MWMCTGYCGTFILLIGPTMPGVLHSSKKTTHSAAATRRERTKVHAHTPVLHVIQFFWDTLNNQCRLPSNPYSPYLCLQDIKHQLLCQIVPRSQGWQVGHTNEGWRNTSVCAHKGSHTQISIHPQKQFFFWNKGGNGGTEMQLAS